MFARVYRLVTDRPLAFFAIVGMWLSLLPAVIVSAAAVVHDIHVSHIDVYARRSGSIHITSGPGLFLRGWTLLFLLVVLPAAVLGAAQLIVEGRRRLAVSFSLLAVVVFAWVLIGAGMWGHGEPLVAYSPRHLVLRRCVRDGSVGVVAAIALVLSTIALTRRAGRNSSPSAKPSMVSTG